MSQSSQEMIISILSKNDNIKDKKHVLEFLLFLNYLIPENAKDNFYNNIKTLKIHSVENSFTIDNTYENVFATPAEYNSKENTLYINIDVLEAFKMIVLHSHDAKERYDKEERAALLHELTHMASSRYDTASGVSYCGFDKYPAEDEVDKNRGLTEGFTECITFAGVPGVIEIGSGYYIEALITIQLMNIVGKEVFYESYFSNKGISLIEEKLNSIIDAKTISNCLFRQIEENFIQRHNDAPQNHLGGIQTMLIHYLFKHLNTSLKEGKISIEDTIEHLNKYEQFLITPRILEIMKKNPDNYILLDESIKKFESIKEFFESKRKVEEQTR